MGHLKTATGNFRIEIEGPEGAPALMLSNSLGTDLHMWDPQIPALARKFRVIRYDSRGHGGSIAEPGPYSIAMLGQDALAIMDALALPKTHWLGLSLGGMVGQWLLAHAPARLGRVVLANTSSFMPDARPWNTRIVNVQKNGMASVTGAVIERWFTPEFQSRNPAAVERIADMLRLTPTQGYIAACAAVRDMDQRETIRRANNPTLVIAGTRDPATPPSLCKNIVEAIADAQYVEFDTAHLSNIEEPEAFTSAVITFLFAKAAKKSAAKKAPAKKAPAKKKTAKKKRAAKKPAGKTKVKKAAGKAAKKTTKKTTKKTVKKAVKKAVRKKATVKAVAKKIARRPAPKKTARKAATKTKKRSAR